MCRINGLLVLCILSILIGLIWFAAFNWEMSWGALAGIDLWAELSKSGIIDRDGLDQYRNGAYGSDSFLLADEFVERVQSPVRLLSHLNSLAWIAQGVLLGVIWFKSGKQMPGVPR